MNHSLYCNTDGFSKIQFQMCLRTTQSTCLVCSLLIFYNDQAGCVQGVRHVLCVVTWPHVGQVETDANEKIYTKLVFICNWITNCRVVNNNCNMTVSPNRAARVVMLSCCFSGFQRCVLFIKIIIIETIILNAQNPLWYLRSASDSRLQCFDQFLVGSCRHLKAPLTGFERK